MSAVVFVPQGHAAKLCDMAEDTAGLQNCLRNRLDVAQKKLNSAFGKIEAKVEDEQKADFKELQKSWLNYRDQECMWEAEQASSDSLKVINELSCMSVITENRANLLESAYSEYDMMGPREFSNTPRWINVLSKDHSGHQWNIDDVYNGDLNCDGRDEIIVTGVSYKPSKVKRSEDDTENDNVVYYQKNIAVAVIQNPDVGRPNVTKFDFPVSKDGADQSLCDKKIKFDLIEGQKDTDKGSETEAKECSNTVKISQSSCENYLIENSNNGFSLQEKPKPENSEKSE